MKEDCKENFPLNARRSLSSEEEVKTNHKRASSSEKEVRTNHRRSSSSDEEGIFRHRRSINKDIERAKHKQKRDACNNRLPLSKKSSDQLEVLDETKEISEAGAPRRPRKKIRPLRERVIDLTDDLSDDSSELSASSDSPSSSSVPVLKKPVKKPIEKSVPESTDCKYCRETEEKVTKCSAPLEGASKEKDMLNFQEIQSSWKIDDELPCVKLVNFRVYDKARHLCPFDGKLIKARDGLYFSGFVKPYDSETTNIADLFPCEDLGPITDWWFEGFDLNDESSLGLTTEMAHYYLETPMAEYVPFMASVKEKIFLAKIVIDILENVSEDDELSYEGLLNSLKDKVPPEGLPIITEEILLRNGVFVCEQIQSYDAAADENEKLMASMMCIEKLSRKIDYDFGAKSDDDSDDEDTDDSVCMIGEIERPVIDFIDLDDLDSSDNEDGGRRARRRCRKYYHDLDWLYEDDEAETKRGRKRRKNRDDRDYIGDEGEDAEEGRERKLRHRLRHHKGPIRRRSPTRRVMMPTKTIKLSKATTTPLVENIFESFFSGEIMRNYTKDYSDPASSLTTNGVYNSTKSYDDFNLKIPNLCVPKLEDIGIDWEDHKIRFPCEWSDEEASPVSEPQVEAERLKSENKQENETVKVEPKDEQVRENGNEKIKPEENEKMAVEDELVLENEEKNTESDQMPEKGEQSEPVLNGKKEMDDLSISLPVTREFKSVALKSLDREVSDFYANKNKRRRQDIISLDSDDDDSDSEHTSKRKKMSEKPEKEDDSGYTVPEFRQMLKRKKTRRSSPAKIKWIDEPYKEVDGYEYHKKVQINDSTVSIGDFISTYNSNSIGCVKYLFENADEELLFHIHWFTRSMDTILAEVGHPNELYESDKCEDVSIEEFYQVVSVKFVPTGSDWFETGNMPYVNQLNKNEDPSRFLYYQKRYCEKTARFYDAEPESSCSLFDCYNCERQRKLVQREIPYSEETSTFDKDHKMFTLKMIQWRDEEYHIGTCVFLTPGSIMKLESKENEEQDEEEEYDEDLYPEKYRKPSHFRSVQDEDVLSDPFEIGYICAIWSRKKTITKSADVKLKLKKFYRPHNTSLSRDEIRKLDLNLLYSSDEECTVDFTKVQGKCYVSYKNNLSCSVDEWTQKGPYRFYFCRSYNSASNEFESPSSSAAKIGNLEKDDENDHVDIPKEYPPISRPLRSLDVFAGCGGLTEGLHQAKVAECHWAIEKDTAAAKAFKSNYPDAAVFTDDCNLLLNAVITRQEKVWAGKKLPQKGDVEMICGGPPCQGFSGMNRFRFGQWSKFNNSLVVTFLSYCDYYRPRFFVMENVRNFVSHEKSVVLKLTLNCLVKMGYQVAFGVLQSGRYGIPQSRRRVIILAAAPGETLPLHPEATHTFALRGFEAVMVDDSKYVTSNQWSVAAPYRMITVYDALSDLPPIKVGDSQLERSYCRKPVTHFQRQLRSCNEEGKEETVLRDHISKSLNALVVKRLSFIPKKLGCDWRDLPNIVVKLSDGTMTKKLEYTHHDVKQGKASNGSLRGVCSCASNEKCRPEFRQSNTIIPWCLPHTSNRHGHWRGLYGRLGWDEYFRTVVTNPEPMGKQGRVVHPEEDRVISVKECARSQGFPDRFKFYGYILDKHRQIGNAVAPPLAKAIGLEIRKCIHEKESKVQNID